MKRIFLFVLTNLAVVVVLGIVASLLGVNRYLTANGLNLGALLDVAVQACQGCGMRRGQHRRGSARAGGLPLGRGGMGDTLGVVLHRDLQALRQAMPYCVGLRGQAALEHLQVMEASRIKVMGTRFAQRCQGGLTHGASGSAAWSACGGRLGD